MQFRQKTLAELRRMLGTLARRDKFIYGQVLADPAPTSTTFALAAARKYSDESLTGLTIYAVSGTGAGQSALVSDSAAGTGVLTLTPALTTTFDATTVVEGWPDEITPEAVNNNLNMALLDVEDIINVYVETASPTIDSESLVVTIPDNFVKLVGVRYRDAGGLWRLYRYRHQPDLPRQEQQRDFTVMGRSLYLSEPLPSDATDFMICGYRLPNELVDDDDLAECPAAFLVYKAAALTEQALTGPQDVDSEGHSTRGAQWLAQAMALRGQIPNTNFLPNTVILDV